MITTHDPEFIKIDKLICEITGADLVISHDFSENIANMLLWLNVTKISELVARFNCNKDMMIPFADKWIRQRNYKMFNHGISLMYLCYLILAKEGDVNRINIFANEFGLGKHVENFGEHLVDVFCRLNTNVKV